jgi:chromosome segregation ATPase
MKVLNTERMSPAMYELYLRAKDTNDTLVIQVLEECETEIENLQSAEEEARVSADQFEESYNEMRNERDELKEKVEALETQLDEINEQEETE